MSQSEKRRCLLLLLLHGKKKIKNTQNKQTKEPHQNQHSGAWGTGLWFPKGAGVAVSRPATAAAAASGPAVFTTAISRPLPSCLSAHWRYQKFQIFKAVSAFSVYMLGFFNDSWPDKVQHLPHTDIGPFPVLGISVFCWSNSDSNFKMFSAAMSWQDATSFPIPWLIRGG